MTWPHEIPSCKICPNIVWFKFHLQSAIFFPGMEQDYLRIPTIIDVSSSYCVFYFRPVHAVLFVTCCTLLELTGSFNVRPGGTSLGSQHLYRNVRWFIIYAKFWFSLSNCFHWCTILGQYQLDIICARHVMVIIIGNGHGDTSSNPGWDWLHFT